MHEAALCCDDKIDVGVKLLDVLDIYRFRQRGFVADTNGARVLWDMGLASSSNYFEHVPLATAIAMAQ